MKRAGGREIGERERGEALLCCKAEKYLRSDLLRGSDAHTEEGELCGETEDGIQETHVDVMWLFPHRHYRAYQTRC